MRPASPDLWCPKCNAMNDVKKTHIWQVLDERGAHYECTSCTYSWPIRPRFTGTTST